MLWNVELRQEPPTNHASVHPPYLYSRAGKNHKWERLNATNGPTSPKRTPSYLHTYKKPTNGLDMTLAKATQRDIIAQTTPNTEAQFISLAVRFREHHNERGDAGERA